MLRSHECRYCAQWKDNPRAVVYTARGISHYIPAMWLAGRVLMSGDKWVGGYYQACKDWAKGCAEAGEHEQAIRRADPKGASGSLSPI